MVVRRTRDQKVSGSSPAEAAGKLLLRGQLSVLTRISVSFPSSCYRSSTQQIPFIPPKVQVAGDSQTRMHSTYSALNELTW